MTAEPPPPCAVVTASGRCAEVRVLAGVSVGELADALGLARQARVTIDGVDVARGARVVDSGMRRGSLVAAAVGHGTDMPGDDDHAVGFEAAVLAGPACTPWRSLARARILIGRAADADITVDDPGIEPYHAVLVVGAGRDTPPIGVTQLAGRAPIDVARRDGVVTISVGNSVVGVRRVDRSDAAGWAPTRGTTVASRHDPWRRVLHRAPPMTAPPVAGLPTPPDPPSARRGPGAIGLVGTGVAAVGAAVVAGLVGQPMLVAFALVGAVASLATWVIGWTVAAVQHRREIRAFARSVDTYRLAVAAAHEGAHREHRRAHPSVSDVLTAVAHQVEVLWARRPAAGAPLRATCGRGEMPWPATEAAIGAAVTDGLPTTLPDVAIPFTLEQGATVAVRGDAAVVAAVGRAIVAQLAALYGPADWQLVAVVADEARWSWLRWLPHTRLVTAARSPATDAALLDIVDSVGDRATTTATDPPRIVVLTDVPEVLASRTGAMRRVLDGPAATGLVLVDSSASPPAVASVVYDVGATGVISAGATGRARVTGIDVVAASRFARSFAHLVDPERDDVDTHIPTAVAFGDTGLGDPDGAAIARRWAANGRDPAPVVVLGRAADGVVDVDLVRDGPHALVAGTTGAGKSELLRTLVVGLAAGQSPAHLNLVLVDFKGGSTFDACARLPHTVGVVTDLDEDLAVRALVGLDAEITRRERLLRDAGADDLTAYRARASTDPLPRLLVVVDEFAGLAGEHPDLLASLVAIAQRGRSLGVHLVLATQRPAGVVTDDIRANTNLRLALRLASRTEALDVVGDPVPATFSRRVPGRAALRLADDELVVFQTAQTSHPRVRHAGRIAVTWTGEAPAGGLAADDATDVVGGVREERAELDRWVDAICAAATIGGYATPVRPWLPPLPALLGVDDLPSGESWERAVGVVDDPAHQCSRPLRWHPATGNLGLCGQLGSGVTSTAVAIVAETVLATDPAACHVYVVDGAGDTVWDAVAVSEHVAAIVRLDDTERVWRLLARLACEVDRRSGARHDGARVLLVIDGIDALRAALTSLGLDDTLADLARVLQSGPAMGITTCLTTDRVSTAAALPVAERWLFGADVDGATSGAGAAARGASDRVPPGRLRVASCGLTAQVLAPGTRPVGTSKPGGRGGPRPLDVLPTHVPRAALPTSDRADATDVELAVGIAADDLAPATILVPRGDHLFVGGTARTGTTTALRTIVAGWRTCHPTGAVVDITPAAVGTLRGRLADRPPETPILLVVDDADRVDDVDGVLAAVAAGHDPHVMMAVAARLDAVRVAYGHWSRTVARRRCGIVLTSAGEIDGELLGALLPRRTVIPPRPGLGWVIDRRGHRLVQVATASTDR